MEKSESVGQAVSMSSELLLQCEEFLPSYRDSVLHLYSVYVREGQFASQVLGVTVYWKYFDSHLSDVDARRGSPSGIVAVVQYLRFVWV